MTVAVLCGGGGAARLLAGMVADPKQADEALLESWVRDFNSWEIVDGVADLARAGWPDRAATSRPSRDVNAA